jgi:hypothetical protein
VTEEEYQARAEAIVREEVARYATLAPGADLDGAALLVVRLWESASDDQRLILGDLLVKATGSAALRELADRLVIRLTWLEGERRLELDEP